MFTWGVFGPVSWEFKKMKVEALMLVFCSIEGQATPQSNPIYETTAQGGATSTTGPQGSATPTGSKPRKSAKHKPSCKQQ